MGKVSAVEWSDSSWSPWRGCTKVSAGCRGCYAERRAKRVGEDFSKIIRSKTTFRDPLKWEEPRMIFVGHLSDFFHEDVPEEWRREAWEIMCHAKGSGHTFLILTKRPEKIPGMLPAGWIEGMHAYWPHLWLGATAENQEMANIRTAHLLKVPAAKHFLSVEPMLESIDLEQIDDFIGCDPTFGSIDLLICGGESGPNFRPMKKEWPIDLQDQCAEAGIPFFFKQVGGNRKIDGHWGGNKLDGREYEEMPE